MIKMPDVTDIPTLPDMNISQFISWLIFHMLCFCGNIFSQVKYKKNPAPDGHRCGVCPTYFQKVCAFDLDTNRTYIFDNHCVMDLYNCIEGLDFIPLNYDRCLYFGNFAYVHGLKREDRDYGEDHFIITNSKKNPDFADIPGERFLSLS